MNFHERIVKKQQRGNRIETTKIKNKNYFIQNKKKQNKIKIRFSLNNKKKIHFNFSLMSKLVANG